VDGEIAEIEEVEEVKEVKEAKEVKWRRDRHLEVNGIEKQIRGVRKEMSAAFFDIDGTLLAKPSLERRFFWELHRCGKIPARNYFLWLAEIMRLRFGLRGLRAAVQSNKTYLCGVSPDMLSTDTLSVDMAIQRGAFQATRTECTEENHPASDIANRAENRDASSSENRTANRSENPDADRAENRAAHRAANCATNRAERRAESWLPEFYPAALQRVWWHALRGDEIVLVSGTLEPLAQIVKFALERELLCRGVETKISVLATQLEIRERRWTGEVAGAAIFGQEKAFAIKEFACAQNISLAHCSAYGDSSLDRWMLDAVGHSFAVNPTRRLRRIARSLGWPILNWTHSVLRSAREQRTAASEQSTSSGQRTFPEQRYASERRISGDQQSAGERISAGQLGLKKSLKLRRQGAR